jgi:hypothetical protein
VENETEIKDKGSRCKVIAVFVSSITAVVLLAAAFAAYAFIQRPVNLGMSRMASFADALAA